MKKAPNYVKGEFVTYRAVAKVHLGKLESDIWEGDTLEFDGSTVRYAGEEHSLGALRGAIEAGWLVPEEDNISRYVPKRNAIRMHKANKAEEMADEDSEFLEISDEQRVVGTLEGSKAKTKASVASRSDRHTPSADSGEVALLKAQLAQMQDTLAKLTGGKVKKAAVVQDDDDEDEEDDIIMDSNGQEAVAVARIRTSTDTKFRMDDARAVQKAKDRDLNTVTRAEQLRKPVKQASSVRLSVDSATGDVQEAAEALDVEDLLPNMVSSKKPVSKVTSSDTKTPKDVNAVMFVTASNGTKIPWNKRSHWKSRIRTAIEQYGDDPKTLKAIAAVEDAGVKKELLAHLGK